MPERAPRKRNETRDVLRPILAKLNRMPGVRVVRNHNVGAVVPYRAIHDPHPPVFQSGLGDGSADLVGIVRCAETASPLHHRAGCSCLGHHGPCDCGAPYAKRWGRAFCLEVKNASDPARGLRAGALSPDERRWLGEVRKLGGFAAVVHSVDEALAAVARCRAGESE